MNKNLICLSLIITLTLLSAYNLQTVWGATETTLIVEVYEEGTNNPVEGIHVLVNWGVKETSASASKSTDQRGMAVFDKFNGWDGDVYIWANPPPAPGASAQSTFQWNSGYGGAQHTLSLQHCGTCAVKLYIQKRSNADSLTRDFTGFYIWIGLFAVASVVLLVTRRKGN